MKQEIKTLIKQKEIESTIKPNMTTQEESEKQKKRADFRYPLAKVGEITLEEVHKLVKKNVTEEYRCRYDLEGPKGSQVYVLIVSPR